MHYARIPTLQASLLCSSFHAPGAHSSISPPEVFLQYSEKIPNATRSELRQKASEAFNSLQQGTLLQPSQQIIPEPTRLPLGQECVDMLLK